MRRSPDVPSSKRPEVLHLSAACTAAPESEADGLLRDCCCVHDRLQVEQDSPPRAKALEGCVGFVPWEMPPPVELVPSCSRASPRPWEGKPLPAPSGALEFPLEVERAEDAVERAVSMAWHRYQSQVRSLASRWR